MKQETSREQEYDGLVNLTLVNLFTLGKENKTLRLWGFDRKDKEHLFILQVALMAHDIFGYRIQVCGTRWNIFWLNRKVCKHFDKVERADELYTKGSVITQDLIAFMRRDGKTRLGEDFTFADIYNQYYEGNLN